MAQVGIMGGVMLNQKQAPVDIDVSAIQKYVGSNRTDLVDMDIEMLERNGYIVGTSFEQVMIAELQD